MYLVASCICLILESLRCSCGDSLLTADATNSTSPQCLRPYCLCGVIYMGHVSCVDLHADVVRIHLRHRPMKQQKLAPGATEHSTPSFQTAQQHLLFMCHVSSSCRWHAKHRHDKVVQELQSTVPAPVDIEELCKVGRHTEVGSCWGGQNQHSPPSTSCHCQTGLQIQFRFVPHTREVYMLRCQNKVLSLGFELVGLTRDVNSAV